MKNQSTAKWKRGALCTVLAHYGHTDESKVMKIIGFEYNNRYQSKLAVWVDGLTWAVDKSLVKLVEP